MYMEQAGAVDYKMKDEKNQVLSKQAAEHFAKYRIRCNECDKNFCTLCGKEPYHLG